MSLTEIGRQTFVPLFCRHTALIKRAFQDVSSEELQQLERVLNDRGGHKVADQVSDAHL